MSIKIVIGPTTKDLAIAAGVSLATVDRVLNKRPNVSEKSRQKVTEAIERIAFVRNLAAVNLGRNKPYRFRFILPSTGDQYLEVLLEKVRSANVALKPDMTITEAIQIAMEDPHIVANYLGQLSSTDVDGVAIMAPESPQVRDAMARLHDRGVHVVQFLSGQEKLDKLDFVGVNNFAAGATSGRIIGRFLNGIKGKVMIITETMQALDSIERRFGFDDVINSKFSGLHALPSLETYGNSQRAERIISKQLEHNSDIVAAYILSSEARMPVEFIANRIDLSDLTVVVHERTPFTEESLRNESIDAVIAQNPGHAVRSALRILRARSENREPLTDQESIRIEILLNENL